MKYVFLLGLLLVSVLTTVIPHVGEIKSHVPRTYKVQINDPPEVRWRQIIKDYSQPLREFMVRFEEIPIPEGFYNGVQYYAKNVFTHQDFVAEVDAIAKLGGYPFEQVFFLNFFYEFSTFKACSGILVRNSAGRVMHGRNLDFQFWNLFSNLAIKMDYYQGDQKVFTLDAIVGSAFALTGIHYGAFSANIDTRKAKNFSNDLISLMLDDSIPTAWLLRKVLEEETSYTGAIKRLKYTEISGPVYYVISGIGPDEGGVIERDTNKVHGFYELSEERWFLVQTNYDRDEPDPVHDPRRIPVENRLRERGNIHFEEQDLLDEFMSIWPTFNIATIMSVVMVPATNYHNTTVWYGHNPPYIADS